MIQLQLKASDIASCIGKNKYKSIDDVLSEYVDIHQGEYIDHNYDIEEDDLREVINDNNLGILYLSYKVNK